MRTNHEDSQGTYASPTLSGKDSDGQSPKGHGHAHYLPTPATGGERRRITHVTVFAADGFTPQELASFQSLRRLNLDNEIRLRIQLVGLGAPGDFNCQILGRSENWISATPYVGHCVVGRKERSRYLLKTLKRDWRKLSEARSEYTGVEIVEVAEVDPEEYPDPARDFRRSRLKHLSDGHRPCGYFMIRFSRPVSGPLTLGYASHFGLGLFQPVSG